VRSLEKSGDDDPTTFSVSCATMSPMEFRDAPVMARVVFGCDSNECWYMRAIDRAAIVGRGRGELFSRSIRSNLNLALARRH
jgi:hypothetical protein